MVFLPPKRAEALTDCVRTFLRVQTSPPILTFTGSHGVLPFSGRVRQIVHGTDPVARQEQVGPTLGPPGTRVMVT
jgi:hypothetical protein